MRSRKASLWDAKPEEWDETRKTVEEGFPDQKRIEKGYWTDQEVDNFYRTEAGDLIYDGGDVIDKPPHYNQGGIECIDYIEQQLTPEGFEGYLAGNAMKYLHRFRHKNGEEDLKKQLWYVQRLSAYMTKKMTEGE